MTKHNLLLTVSVLSGLVGLGGQAQAQAAAGGTTVGEVVVTAQRRTERLVDVPLTVAVVTGAQLAQRGITDTLGLTRVTSGVMMPINGFFLAPSIRGISANATQAGVPENVAFYVDGVYQPSQIGGIFDLPDIQDIEILKGPQGTLYGQNAEGGAIVINTLAPQFKWRSKASVSYGNYNDIRVVGYETGPISDAIAQSLSAEYERRDGFLTNLYTGKRIPSVRNGLVRGKLLFKPNDKTELTFTAFWSSNAGIQGLNGSPYNDPSCHCLRSVAINYDRNGNLLSSDPAGTPSVLAGVDRSKTANGPMPDLGSRDWGADLKGGFDVGLGKLTMLTSFAETNASFFQDVSASPLWMGFSNSTVTSQATIVSGDFVSRPIGPVEFSTGLFYEHFIEDYGPDNNYTAYSFLAFGFPPLAPHFAVWPSPAPNNAVYVGKKNQPAVRDVLAGYLEGTWHVTSAFTITAGGRYNTDTEHGYYQGIPGPVVELPISPASWNNFAPRVTARYKLTPSSNVYFNYSEGYRSGLLNVGNTTQAAVKPETLDAYEVGYKGTLFNQLTLGLAGFYYQYKNKQESFYNGVVYLLQNAASATNDGVDLDATWVATPQLTFTASAEWLEARYGSYGQVGCPVVTACAAVYVPDPNIPGLLDAVTRNLSHRQEERAPKWSGTVSADYHVDTQMGRFTANASVYYSSKVNWDENALVSQNPYATLDMELGFAPASQPNLRFVLWGRNLTDAAYYQSTQDIADAATVVYAPPRQFGGRVEFKF